MRKFNRSEQLAIYSRLLVVLVVCLVVALVVLFKNGTFSNVGTPTDIENPSNEEQTTAPTQEPSTEEPSTEEPSTEEPTTEPPTLITIEDDFYEHALFIGESRIEGLYTSGLFDLSDFLYDSAGSIGGIEDEYFTLNDEGSYYIEDVLAQTTYDKVFLMFGMNELGWSNNDYYIEQYQLLIDMIKESNPEVTIYVQSVVYVTEGYEEDVEWISNTKVDDFNTALKSICDGSTVVFLDINPALTTDGYLLGDNSTNGFQFTEEHMAVWKQALKDELLKAELQKN